MSFDKFGVTQLYTTKSGGKEWACQWGEQALTYETGSYSGHTGYGDVFDPMVYYHGNTAGFKIYGYEDNPDLAGCMSMWGKAPRFYVAKYSDRPSNPLGLPTVPGYGNVENPTIESWGSLEMTVYCKFLPLSSTDPLPATYSGITMGCWTNHFPDYFPSAIPNSVGERWGDYSSRCYYGQLQQTLGKAYHKKELFFNATVALDKSTYPFLGQSIPSNTWIGIKFICRAYETTPQVRLDLYLDQFEGGALGGVAGGTWERILTNVDYDGWDLLKFAQTPEKMRQAAAQTYNGIPAGTLGSYWNGLTIRPDRSSTCHKILLRIDEVLKEKQYFKWFTIREIDDIPPPPPNVANYKVGNCIQQ